MSYLQLLRARTPVALHFEHTDLQVIDRNGAPWLLPEHIGRALQMANTRRTVLNLFNRNRAEFGPDETAEIELDVEHGTAESRHRSDDAILRGQVHHTRRIKVRIFSLRGANLLAMLARTDVARRFRKWVLDLIERGGSERSFYGPYRQVVEWEFGKHPRWAQVHPRLTWGEPVAVMARHMGCAASTVRRAIQHMREAGIVAEREYTLWREDARHYGKALRDHLRQRQLSLGF